MTEQQDHYLWLESLDSRDALDWVEGQNALSRAVLDADPRFAPLCTEILANLRDTRQIPFFEQHDDWLYNFHQSEDQPRGIYRRTRLAAYRAGESEWQTVLDLDRLAAEAGRDWYLDDVSHYVLEPARCLLTLSDGGSDAAETREYDLEAQEFVPGGFAFPLGKSHIAWRGRDSLFVCPAWEAAQCSRSGYPRSVYILRRGQAWHDAQHILTASAEAMMVAAWRFLDCAGTHLDMVEDSDGFYHKRYHILADDGSTRPLDLPEDAEVLAWLDGDLVLRIVRDWRHGETEFPSGALLTMPSCGGAPSLLFDPGPRASVRAVESSRSFILVDLLENVQSRLVAFERVDGRWCERVVAAQAGGVLGIVDQPWNSDVLYYSYSDFLTPAGLYRLELPDGQPECLRAQPAAFDASPFLAEQLLARAPDGTEIPYFVVRPRELPQGGAPALLYGYGGFEVSMQPDYVDNFGPHWLQKGGIFAVANIRGGGEFGPVWHQAAQGVRRPVSFEDFISVAEDMIRRGLTRPEKLAIEGGSNGGLLVGAAMVRRPELFAAVVCEVPLLDMLRYTQLFAGASWMDEYGNPDDEDERPQLAAYSPYHQLRADVSYPPVLFTTSRSDDRVHPAHARKMVARMNELGHQPLLCETDSGGHSGNSGQEQTAVDLARVLVYLYQRLFD
jgi:prolyl oligopeptidase